MRYQSLKEIWDSLDDDITDPYQIAKDFDCIVIEKILPKHIQGFTEPISQYIFINQKLNHRFKRFVVAHELIHSLIDKSPSYLEENSSVNTIKKEARANKGAFFLLLRNFYSIFNVEEFDILDFMKYYQIPEKYYYFFEQCIKEVIVQK